MRASPVRRRLNLDRLRFRRANRHTQAATDTTTRVNVHTPFFIRQHRRLADRTDAKTAHAGLMRPRATRVTIQNRRPHPGVRNRDHLQRAGRAGLRTRNILACRAGLEAIHIEKGRARGHPRPLGQSEDRPRRARIDTRIATRAGHQELQLLERSRRPLHMRCQTRRQLPDCQSSRRRAAPPHPVRPQAQHLCPAQPPFCVISS